jgi:hypothetical protein
MPNENPLKLLPQPRHVRLTSGQFDRISSTQVKIAPTLSRPQGYRVEIDDQGDAKITVHDDAGLFYANKTLEQIQHQLQLQHGTLQTMVIEDWPDFLVRGFMLDISRDKVPTMQTLFQLVDLLAELKINQLQLYTEHTFAYRDHEIVWKDASPMTAQEIRQLDAYCRARFIELVPNQNSFGHMERWLKHPQYQHLAEVPEGYGISFGAPTAGGFSLCPTDPRSIAFVESLYDELLPNFTSRLFNVGCDETLDIGLGRSKTEVEQRGRERVYLDFVKQIHAAVARRGRTMMFWGDIILHKPELLRELPGDLIALNWGYEADHPFDAETRAFKDAGVPFYVCPGTSSWCSILGRSENAIANLRSAAEHGLKNGAIGYLVTDWGDQGHVQYLPTSYLPLAIGAAFAWCLESNRNLNSLLSSQNLHIFHDASGRMAQVMYELGNVAAAMTTPIKNGTSLFWALIDDPARRNRYADVTIDEYRAAEARIDNAARGVPAIRMNRSDVDLILAELRNGVQMLRYACARGIFLKDASTSSSGRLRTWMQDILSEHRRLWLARNRPGGLADSAARLERIINSYNS